ncbi:MAG TPA: MASE1 domain-containing protein [Devosiaceae bacterium]|jgi:two-component sensor histidine kinase/integral membrane sensor domain MASE1|nr:MASE1 domain-containing protein [Devosiaceae bacterium]
MTSRAGEWLRQAQLPLGLLGLALAYFLGAKLGIATSLPPAGIVVVWPPNAVLLIALLFTSRAHWWMLVLAAIAAEVVADVPQYPLWSAVGYGVVNATEAVLAALLLLKTRSVPIRGVRDYLRFVAIGPVLASALAALLGAAIYKLGSPELDYLHYWQVFWFGDGLGLLIIGSSLLGWMGVPSVSGVAGRSRLLETAVVGVAAVVTFAWVFFLAESSSKPLYLVFPFLLWAALRLGVRGAAVTVPVVTVFAVASAVNGFGPFAASSDIATVPFLQLLLVVVALTTFVLGYLADDALRREGELLSAEKATRSAYEQVEAARLSLDQEVATRMSELEMALARNEMLYKELQHRVKNNLQLVSSLLTLHGRSIGDPSARQSLDDVRSQVSAIAATYDVLHQLPGAESVDFSEVLPLLCNSISGAGGEMVSMQVEAPERALIDADKAVALSLVVNELITNSIKHGTRDGAVSILVSARCVEGEMVVRISDNGPGFPPDFNPGHSGGFGMRMARTVLAQADSRLRYFEGNEGAAIELYVPLYSS